MTQILINKTEKYCVYDVKLDLDIQKGIFLVFLGVNCNYTYSIIQSAIDKRQNCKVSSKPVHITDFSLYNASKPHYLQICDFENIDWNPIFNQKFGIETTNSVVPCGASSYLIRKGLSRKAQLSIQIKKYACKHSDSILNTSVPFTVVVETWNAFEDMKVKTFSFLYAFFLFA
jgi:hypothetical protein